MRSKNFKDLGGWTFQELLEFLIMIRPHVSKAGFELGIPDPFCLKANRQIMETLWFIHAMEATSTWSLFIVS
jgi:hypothetical protein